MQGPIRWPGEGPEPLLMTKQEMALRTAHPPPAGSGRWSPRGGGAAAARAAEGLGLEEDDGDGFIIQEESEQNFDVLEKRARKAAMDARESARLLAKGALNMSQPGRLYEAQKVCGREFHGGQRAVQVQTRVEGAWSQRLKK